MALSLSTGLVNFIAGNGSRKRALIGGEMRIYSGTPPTTADNAVTGTLLVTLTNASGTRTPEVLSSGTVTLTGTTGGVATVTVNSVDILGTAVAFNSSLTQTAADVATQINTNLSNPEYTATSSGAIVTIKALPNTGTTPNTYVVAATYTGDMGGSYANMSGGVAHVNGLTYGSFSGGALNKSGVWSGTVASTGTAGYFRIIGSEANSDASSTTAIRIQGTCGTSGADYIMSSTTLTSATNHTVDTGTMTENKT